MLGPCPISIADTDFILGGSDLSDFFEPPKTPKRIKNSKRGNADNIHRLRFFLELGFVF